MIIQLLNTYLHIACQTIKKLVMLDHKHVVFLMLFISIARSTSNLLVIGI